MPVRPWTFGLDGATLAGLRRDRRLGFGGSYRLTGRCLDRGDWLGILNGFRHAHRRMSVTHAQGALDYFQIARPECPRFG